MTPSLSFHQLQQQRVVPIDTRHSAFFNGWPSTPGGTSGHEPGALNLAACWLEKMDDETLRTWASAHDISRDTVLALYGEAQERERVRQRLTLVGINSLFTLSDALTQPSRLVRLPGYQQWVPAQWISDLIQGKSIAARPAGTWRILEITSGEKAGRAATLPIEALESGPLFNVVPVPQLVSTLARYGIRFDTTVILHSHHPLAAARAAHILLYAGVQDVRLLDGNELTLEANNISGIRPEADFAAPVPSPGLLIDRAQARTLLTRTDALLVSVRSWQEYSGETSGYDYIHATGDIPGARWGHAGEGKDGMEDYLNPDGTVRGGEEITAMWQACHITAEQEIAFYCGTGWRASLAFMCARAMGWPRIAVYDGGWYEWSQHYQSGEIC